MIRLSAHHMRAATSTHMRRSNNFACCLPAARSRMCKPVLTALADNRNVILVVAEKRVRYFTNVSS